MAIDNHCSGRNVAVDKFVEISDYILDRVNHQPETRLEMRLTHINVLLDAIYDVYGIEYYGTCMPYCVLDSSSLSKREDRWDGMFCESPCPRDKDYENEGLDYKHLRDIQAAAVIVAVWSNDEALLTSLTMEGSRYPVDLVTGDPLNYAVKKGLEGIARLLIQMKGFRLVDEENPTISPDYCHCLDHHPDSFTAVHFAAKHNNVPILHMMIAHGFDLEIKTKGAEQTALHIASIYGSQDFTRVLLQHIRNVNPRDIDDLTPLFCAAFLGESGALEALLSDMRVEINYGREGEGFVGETIFSLIVAHKFTRSIELILGRKELIIDFRFSEVFSAVDYVVQNCSEAVVQLLVQQDWININVLRFYLDYNLRQTPLMIAVEYDSNELAQLLLARPNIDVNVRDEYGETALMIAARRPYYSCLDTILAHPCVDVNLRNYQGQTALAIAHDYQYSDAIKILRDAGASE